MDTWILDCIYLLTAVNDAVDMYLFKPMFSILWGICLRVELLDHKVILFLDFWGTTKLLTVWMFSLSTSLLISIKKIIAIAVGM